jgi:hypothetical protein
MYGTGLQSGVHWFPPVLRRAVYATLGIRVEVFGDRTVCAEGLREIDSGSRMPRPKTPGSAWTGSSGS